jgi:prevent-host-death family protein
MKTTVVTIHESKTNLSRLIQKASGGEEIIISRGSKPVARFVSIGDAKGRRRPGALKGRFVIGPEVIASLPADELSRWE